MYVALVLLAFWKPILLSNIFCPSTNNVAYDIQGTWDFMWNAKNNFEM